jgi:transposase-like protein
VNTILQDNKGATKMARRMTPEDKQAIKEAVEKGEKVSEVAIRFKTTAVTIYNTLKALGIDTPVRKKKSVGRKEPVQENQIQDKREPLHAQEVDGFFNAVGAAAK